MNVQFSYVAFDKITDLAEFIDDINSPGAGDRWLEKLIQFITDYAQLNDVQWPLCRNQNLASYQYSYLIYKKWVVAFKN
jgi:hypothetical protein